MLRIGLICLALLQFMAREARGQSVEISGQVVTNTIHDFDQIHPDWFDVLRPSKLPAFPDEFGEDGHQWFSVRPTRFMVRPYLPMSLGEIRGIFDFDLLGTGRRTLTEMHAPLRIGPPINLRSRHPRQQQNAEQ